jgi:hypothetical protein
MIHLIYTIVLIGFVRLDFSLQCHFKGEAWDRSEIWSEVHFEQNISTIKYLLKIWQGNVSDVNKTSHYDT